MEKTITPEYSKNFVLQALRFNSQYERAEAEKIAAITLLVGLQGLSDRRTQGSKILLRAVNHLRSA